MTTESRHARNDCYCCSVIFFAFAEGFGSAALMMSLSKSVSEKIHIQIGIMTYKFKCRLNLLKTLRFFTRTIQASIEYKRIIRHDLI